MQELEAAGRETAQLVELLQLRQRGLAVTLGAHPLLHTSAQISQFFTI